MQFEQFIQCLNTTCKIQIGWLKYYDKYELQMTWHWPAFDGTAPSMGSQDIFYNEAKTDSIGSIFLPGNAAHSISAQQPVSAQALHLETKSELFVTVNKRAGDPSLRPSVSCSLTAVLF